jgi:hypothetical protein
MKICGQYHDIERREDGSSTLTAMNNVYIQILQHRVGVSGANVPIFCLVWAAHRFGAIVSINIGKGSKIDRIGRMVFF